MVLIKSVAQAIPTYIMSCFLLPLAVLRRLDQLMANFWWGQKNEERRIHWCSWNVSCSSKDSGGLGFRDLEAFNKALLAKQGWRILSNPESLLARCLRAKYFPKSSFLKTKLCYAPSFSWRSIIAGRAILVEGVRWNIRNGCSVNIRDDPWYPSSHGFKAPSMTVDDPALQVVRDLMNDEGNQWDVSTIYASFTTDAAQKILSIPLSSTQQKDCLQWIYTKNGLFSVKSGYWIAKKLKDVSSSNPSSSSNNPKTWRWIWNLNVPPKVRMFLWRCMRGILQTKTKLLTRGVHQDPICSRCGLAEETLEHALRDCPWSSFYWQVSVLRIEILVPAYSIPLQDWILSIIRNKNSEYSCTFAMLLWMIWKARNSFEFLHKSTPVQECFNIALGLLEEYQSRNMCTALPRDKPTPCLHWIPPKLNWVKLNSDASLTNEGAAGLGGAIRNNMGKVGNIFSLFIPFCSDVEIAEALACRQGVKIAIEAGIQNIVVETDNQNLARMLNSGVAPPSSVGTIVLDILHLSKGFSHISFRWTKRSANRLAHRIARLACNPDFSIDAVDSLPETLNCIVIADIGHL